MIENFSEKSIHICTSMPNSQSIPIMEETQSESTFILIKSRNPITFFSTPLIYQFLEDTIDSFYSQVCFFFFLEKKKKKKLFFEKK